MSYSFDQMLMLRVAKAYYLDGLSQQEIADQEHIHRTQISRILKQAREQGYVQINIAPPAHPQLENLAKQIEVQTGLRQVLIAPQAASGEDTFESYCFFAARQLEKTLTFCKNIGIGLGRTLYGISAQLTRQPCQTPHCFYSVVGFSGTQNSSLQPGVILERFAYHFQGTCHYNNFPIYFRKDTMSPLDIARYQEIQALYEQLDTIVLSVGGALYTNPLMEEFPLTSTQLEDVLKRPHGDLLGHIFYEGHQCYQFPEQYLLSSISPDRLAKIPNVICAAVGNNKVHPIISAAQQKYIDVLITDEETARNILHVLLNRSYEPQNP